MIRTGDIGIVRRHLTGNPASWTGAGVRFWTGSRNNHSFPLIVLEGRVFVSETVFSGISPLIPLELWKKKYPHTLRIIRLESQYNSEADKKERILDVIGRPYDFKSLLWYQLKRQFFRMFEKDHWDGKTDKSGADGHFYCSEHAMYINNYPEWYRYSTAGILEQPHRVLFLSS